MHRGSHGLLRVGRTSCAPRGARRRRSRASLTGTMEEAVLLLAVVAFALVLFGIGRATELFYVRAREGRLELLRGRAPIALVADFRDVLQGVRDADVRAV